MTYTRSRFKLNWQRPDTRSIDRYIDTRTVRAWYIWVVAITAKQWRCESPFECSGEKFRTFPICTIVLPYLPPIANFVRASRELCVGANGFLMYKLHHRSWECISELFFTFLCSYAFKGSVRRGMISNNKNLPAVAELQTKQLAWRSKNCLQIGILAPRSKHGRQKEKCRPMISSGC